MKDTVTISVITDCIILTCHEGARSQPDKVSDSPLAEATVAGALRQLALPVTADSGPFFFLS
jgi:hypothetical protein